MSAKSAKIKAAVLTCALFLLLLGLGMTATAEVVTFWSPFTGPDGVVIETMVDVFNQTEGKEQNVQVEMLIVPWDEYYTKLTVAITSGTSPDLAVAHTERVAGFARQGALLEFRPEVLNRLGIHEDDFIPALWEAGEVNGRRYAIPFDAFPRHIFYNKKLFANAGLDPSNPPDGLEDLILAARALTNREDDVWGLWFALDGSWAYRDFLAIYWQFANDLLSPDNRTVSIEFPDAARRTLEILTDFIHTHQVTPSLPTAFETIMATEKAGMAFSQITHLKALEDTQGLDFGTAPFPQIGPNRATFALGHNFVVPRRARFNESKFEAALTFIEWFNRHALDWAAGGKVPASLRAMEDPRFADLEAQQIAASQLSYMRTPPAVAQMPNVFQSIQENVEAVYAGARTIDEAVSRMEQEIRTILAR